METPEAMGNWKLQGNNHGDRFRPPKDQVVGPLPYMALKMAVSVSWVGQRSPSKWIQMAYLNGLEMAVILTIYKSWDDPPSMLHCSPFCCRGLNGLWGVNG